MEVYTLSNDLRQPIAIDLMTLPLEKFEVEVTGDVALTVKKAAHDVSLEMLDILKENSFHLERFIRTHFEEGDDIGCLPSGLLAYDLSDGTAFDATDGRAFGVALTGEIVRKFCDELTQEPFQFPFGKIMVIDGVKPGDEIDLIAAMASLGTKDYLLLPSAFADDPAVSHAKRYGIHCFPVDTLEDAVTPLVDSGVSFLHGKLNQVQSEIKTLLAEYDELMQKLEEFKIRVKIYIEGKASLRETAKKRLAFLEDALRYLLNEIDDGKFETDEELKDKIEEALNAFDEFPSDDEVGRMSEVLFVEDSDDGIHWTAEEEEQIEKETKTILLRHFHRFVDRRDHTEEDMQNWHRVRNLWKKKDRLLLAAHIICFKADSEIEFVRPSFEQFDFEVEALTYTLKVREGLQNRLHNTKKSEIYHFYLLDQPWLESVSEKLEEEIDKLRPQIKRLEAQIHNLSLEQ